MVGVGVERTLLVVVITEVVVVVLVRPSVHGKLETPTSSFLIGLSGQFKFVAVESADT